MRPTEELLPKSVQCDLLLSGTDQQSSNGETHAHKLSVAYRDAVIAPVDKPRAEYYDVQRMETSAIGGFDDN